MEVLREHLVRAIQINVQATMLNLPEETAEVRELVADLRIRSDRLVRLLAKRVAGAVRENS